MSNKTRLLGVVSAIDAAITMINDTTLKDNARPGDALIYHEIKDRLVDARWFAHGYATTDDTAETREHWDVGPRGFK